MNFKNKNVLITGGSRGIGRACAIAFSKGGANVAINYQSNKRAAKETLDLLENGDNIALQADISNEAEVEQLIKAFEAHYGTLDILVNNAGIFQAHPLTEVSFEDWKQSWKTIIDTNLIAAANLSYCAAQNMIKHGGGRIVNVSSRGAFRGEPKSPAYGASKAGLNSMSQSLAKALAPHNVFIGVVAPGFTETEMVDSLSQEEKDALVSEFPLKRMAKAEEVAHAVLFLASEGAEYMTGTIIDVNGASYLRS